ncbi:MAG: acetyl-CoA hydrolase/transferase C-terminal domain-containing protein [Cytophagales bacterium]|nr:acetyl-CoA hydrolase/transferase C-terminal domain-containing protein [Cytophagales bacterium]
MKEVSASEAVGLIQSGNRVFIHGGAATPHHLLASMVGRASELRDVELVSISLQGEAPFAAEKYKDSFRINSLFVSANIRAAVNEGRGDYIPVFFSEIPGLFSRNLLPIDVALVQVSVPDKHGYCSFGPSVDIVPAAVRCARKVVAQVNPRMPRTHGDGIIHTRAFDAMVYHEQELPEVRDSGGNSAVADRIGAHCANLIEDGATLQLGIGSIPNAVLRSLSGHRALGVHTEMFSDGLLPLVDKGVITNEHKKKHRGKIVTSFVLGSRKVYDFVDDNPLVALLQADYVNDTSVIRKNPKVTAINGALEVDITGQICSDSIGSYQYSGVGGQMDFMRGAALSEGGKPIIALPSSAKGISRIVPFLNTGAGVVTTRAHAHYVVTEHGIASLYGKNMRQRARALISIADPMFRESLEAAARERFGGEF